MTKALEVRPAQTRLEGQRSDPKLEVIALLTTSAATLLALQSASKLARGLLARIRLVVPHVVPYPLPIDEPAIRSCVFSRRLCAATQQAGVECTIDIRLCRDREEAIEQALPARSIVVIGRKPQWWRFQDRELIKRLAQKGHQIVFAELGSIYA